MRVVALLAACPGEEAISVTSSAAEVCVGGTGTLDVSGRLGKEVFTVDTTSVRAALTGRGTPAPASDFRGFVNRVEYRSADGEPSFEFYCLREGPAEFRVRGFDLETEAITFERFPGLECIECGAVDPIGDFIDSISTQAATRREGVFDLVASFAKYTRDFDLRFADFQEALPCGQDDVDGLVLCSDDALASAADEEGFLHVTMKLAEPISRSSESTSLVYAAVLESDGDTANDWVAQPPFDWDLFQQTDRWYQVVYDHQADRWSLVVTQVEPGPPQTQTTVPSAARVVVDGQQISFLIPRGELSGAFPTVRMTSFGHGGMFLMRGADVSGSDPTEAPRAPDPA